MLRLTRPNIKINFAPSAKQMELWNSLQPNRCDKCGGELEMRSAGFDNGHEIFEPVCKKCGNTDIPAVILGGGSAGGGKSYLGCCWIAFSCMMFTGIRAVIARKTLKVLKESTWLTLLNVLKTWGLKEGENYHINNQSGVLTFWNGSTITMMELSPQLQDPEFQRFGSIEITICFIDEASEVSEKAIEVLASRLRYKVAETFVVAKMLMTTNPCLGYIRDRFVMDDEGNAVKLKKGDRYLPFSLFSNPDKNFVAVYYNKLKNIKDKGTRMRLLYGDWRFVSDNKMAAYYNFNHEKHLVYQLKESKYDPSRTYILSMDFNTNPYISSLGIQFNYERKEMYLLEEFIGLPSKNENNTPTFSKIIANKLKDERLVSDVILTGDPAGLQKSTLVTEGINNFTIARDNFNHAFLRPSISLLTKQPSQKTRLEFVNELLAGNIDGWKVFVDERCTKFIADCAYQCKNPDGTKEKKKVLMPDGTKAEQYGHLSDCFDYAAVYFLNKEYEKYKSGNVETVVTTISDYETVYGDFDY